MISTPSEECNPTEIQILQGGTCYGMVFSVLSFLRADMLVIFVSSAVCGGLTLKLAAVQECAV
jgi:hypothetical protein